MSKAFGEAVPSPSATAPTADHPDETEREELEDARKLFELADEKFLERLLAVDDEQQFDYYLQLSGSWLGTSGEPETLLKPDPDTGLWRVDDLFQPRSSRTYFSGSLLADLEYRPTDWFRASLLFDTRAVRGGGSFDPPVSGVRFDGQKASEFFGEASFVRGASLGVGVGAWRARAGRYRVEVLSGLVFDDFATGAGVSADLDALLDVPLTLDLDVVLVSPSWSELDRADPLLVLGVDWRPSESWAVRPAFALHADRNGEVSNAMRSTLVERAASAPVPDRATQFLLDTISAGGGSADLMYAGTELEWEASARTTLNARAAGMAGQFRIGRLDRVIKADLLSGAFDVELAHAFGRYVTVSGLGLLMTGDRPPDSTRYHGFVAIGPYWTWTGLFFAGGLTQGFYPEGAALAGVNGHGVAGGGPSIAVGGDTASTELSAVWLSALAAPPPAPLGGQSFSYGLELDWRARWSPWEHFSLGAEFDVLLPGGYFYEDKTAYRGFILGALSYGN